MPDVSHLLPNPGGMGTPAIGAPAPGPGLFNPQPIRVNAQDADVDHLGFLQSMVAHIETTPWRRLYATIQYPTLVPIDRSAWEWAASIERYTMDGVGAAAPMGNRAEDMPLVATTRERLTQKIEDFWVGYDYSMGEMEQARRIPMWNFMGEKATLANRVMEELIDDIVLQGRPEYGWDGLLTNLPAGVVKAFARPTTGADEAQRNWENKTGLQMARDIQDAVADIWTTSETILMADTVLLSPSAYDLIARTPISADFPNQTALSWVTQNNLYTGQTGQALMVRVCRGLETASEASTTPAIAGGGGRMIAYCRKPEFLRLHMPMTFNFASPYMSGPYRYIVPGMMRTGGLEVRIPRSIRVVDGITATPS